MNDNKPHIIILGAGAIGSTIAGLMTEKNDVLLIGRQRHVAEIKKKGLRLTGKIKKTIFVDVSTKIKEISPRTIIFITTKTHEIKTVLTPDIRKKIQKDTIIVCIQNGLSAEKIVKSLVSCKVVRIVTLLSSTFLKPGVVEVTALLPTYVGKGNKIIRDLLANSGLDVKTTTSIDKEIWKKLNVLMQHLKEQKLGHQLYTSTQISHLEKCIKQFKRTIYPYTEPTDCETLFFSRKRIEKNQDLRLEEARRFAINIFKAIADPVANQRLLDNACQYMRNRKLKIIGAAIIAVISVAVVIFGGFTFNPACLIAGTTGFMGSLFAAGHFKNSGYLHNQVTDIAHTIEPQKRYYK